MAFRISASGIHAENVSFYSEAQQQQGQLLYALLLLL
jgi:hypothetical protein